MKYSKAEASTSTDDIDVSVVDTLSENQQANTRKIMHVLHLYGYIT